ncbi:class I SAM-dependent methyltransferase [Veronia pacifica]|uniref:SAM-dependent methyltransferase n=1 Tax=Veronia pacifica TaxID=1080227 RepID=A0A1C3EPT5_9GAMM|nr:class I SAM-dependent methyltransferase [Veronia pacifica]ODA35236.1 SAM-dependent methyltransferase [Veronia pacifica]
MDDLIARYTDADEDSRLTRQYIAKMEYDTTMYLLRDYLQPGQKVCELGAATGRYSLSFADMGCNVTSVELVPDQVNILTQKAKAQGKPLTIHQGSACSVPFIEDSSQDLCVVLGPLYHLKTERERQQVIEEAQRILKPGGVVALAYIPRFFVAGLFAKVFPELVTPEVMTELTEAGTVSSVNANRFFRVGYFSMPEEMEALLAHGEFSLLRHSATDGIGRLISEGVNHFSPEQYQSWLNYHLATCDEPTLLGASNHGLVIGKKPQ